MAAAARRVLFISNGYGEDAIAAQMVRRLPRSFLADAYPTIGNGNAYRGVCAVVGPRAFLPSEGARTVRNSVARDIFGGALSTFWPGLKFLRHARAVYDRVVVVGDMLGVYACALSGLRRVIYVDVYKTGYGSDYLPFEMPLLRRTAETVFCRSERLAERLRDARIDALCAGNVMMDTIPRAGYDARSRRRLERAVTLLPGSRARTAVNFALQAEALARLPVDLMPDVFLAVAPSLDIATLADAAGLVHFPSEGKRGADDLGTLRGGPLLIHLVPGAALGDALDASDLVLSQAGTVTVQAIGLGRPAVQFRTPQDRPKRIRDETRMYGDARQLVPANPAVIAERVARLLGDPALLARLSALGRGRIGGTGAIDAILGSL